MADTSTVTPIDLARQIDQNVWGTIVLNDTVGMLQLGSSVNNRLSAWFNPASNGRAEFTRAGPPVGASGEAVDVYWDLNRVVTFAAGGAPATQRAYVITPPTYASASGAQTITTAATLAISGAPVAGTNMTITDRYALWVQTGTTCFQDAVTGSMTALRMWNTNFNTSNDIQMQVYFGTREWGRETWQLTDDTKDYSGFSRLLYHADGLYGNYYSSPAVAHIWYVGKGIPVMYLQYPVGLLYLTPRQQTGANGELFWLNATNATHIGMVGESVDVKLALSRTVTFAAASAPATQRAITIDPPTYASASGAQTITTAATLAISGQPVEGTNLTITNPYAFWVQAGDSKFAGKIIPASPQTYNASNVTTDRTYDADSTTIDEIADVLGTLISDLRTIGLVV